MRLPVSLLFCGFCITLSLAAPRIHADTPGPVKISITKPLTPVTDVLTALARQTNQIILPDDTAVAPLDVAELSAPTLDSALDDLKSLDAGLAWQKIYLPKDQPLPTGNDLSAQARALKAVAAAHLIIADPTGTVTFSRKKTDAPATPPDGMRLVYLVSDETVRAQRLAAKTAETAKPKDAGTPVSQTATGMQNVADTFSQMSPDQQRQALPLMFDQFRRIMQSMDPTVRDQMRQQFGGRRGATTGNGTPGNGQ